MQTLLVFDVNETLLDLSSLDPHFGRNFGSASVRREWFSQLLQMAFVATITRRYEDFGVLAKAALEVTEHRHRVSLSPEARARIFETVRNLSPHSDVPEGLEKLRRGGLRMVALTNSPPAIVEHQLTNAGLRDHFERVFSLIPCTAISPLLNPTSW